MHCTLNEDEIITSWERIDRPPEMRFLVILHHHNQFIYKQSPNRYNTKGRAYLSHTHLLLKFRHKEKYLLRILTIKCLTFININFDNINLIKESVDL